MGVGTEGLGGICSLPTLLASNSPPIPVIYISLLSDCFITFVGAKFLFFCDYFRLK